MAEPDDQLWVKAGRFAALGGEFGATIVAGVAAGYYVDEWLNTGPLFLLLLSVGAFAGAIYRMVLTLRRYQ